jgi:uncharacterized repeat protein (TIGR01451 family)
MGRLVLVLVVVGLAAHVRGGDSKGGETERGPSGPRLEVAVGAPSLKSLYAEGGKQVFRVKIANPGNRPANHVVVAYRLSRDHTFLAASDNGRYDPKTRTITWQWDRLAAECTKEFRLDLQRVSCSNWEHKVIVTADGGLMSEANWGFPIREGIWTPLLYLEDPVEPIEVGATGTYELHLWVSQDETDLHLTATIPPGLRFEGVDGLTCLKSEGNLVVFEPIKRLPAKQSVIAKIRVKVLSADADGGRIKVSLTSDDEPGSIDEMSRVRVLVSTLHPSTGYGRDADSLMRMVTPRIIINEEEEEQATGHTRLQLNATGPRAKYPGRKAAYSFTLTATGNMPARNVVLTCQVPAGFRFQSATDGGIYNSKPRTVTWTWNELPANSRTEVRLDTEALQPGDGTYLVYLTAANGLKAQADLSTRVEEPSPVVVEGLSIWVDDPLESESDATYEVRIANCGAEPAGNVDVVIWIPPGLTFKNAAGPTPVKQDGERLVLHTPKLAPRAEAIYRLTFAIGSHPAAPSLKITSP